MTIIITTIITYCRNIQSLFSLHGNISTWALQCSGNVHKSVTSHGTIYSHKISPIVLGMEDEDQRTGERYGEWGRGRRQVCGDGGMNRLVYTRTQREKGDSGEGPFRGHFHLLRGEEGGRSERLYGQWGREAWMYIQTSHTAWLISTLAFRWLERLLAVWERRVNGTNTPEPQHTLNYTPLHSITFLIILFSDYSTWRLIWYLWWYCVDSGHYTLFNSQC